jgi:hypothetical protein
MSKIMFKLHTNVPELDRENAALFEASEILESLGNFAGLNLNQFYAAMIARPEIPAVEHEQLSLAAIAIETMMSVPDEDLETVH